MDAQAFIPMSIEEFIKVFAEDLQTPVEQIRPDTRLNDIPRFDSMGRLTFMTLVDVQFGALIEASAIDQCRTVADLHAAVLKAAGK
jgi:acyl carrier protein